jgi:glycerol-3-phosphate dehydrogenase (NAD(P)+)
MSRIIVLGSGAWGTAIALSLHRRGGHQLSLWAHSPEFAQEIIAAGENKLFLPGFPLPPEIAITGDNAAVADAEIVVSVVPSEFLRSTFARIGPHLHSGQIIVSATKGVEDHTYLRMTQVIAASLAEVGLTLPGLSAPSAAPASRWKSPRASPPPSPSPSATPPSPPASRPNSRQRPSASTPATT